MAMRLEMRFMASSEWIRDSRAWRRVRDTHLKWNAGGPVAWAARATQRGRRAFSSESEDPDERWGGFGRDGSR